MNNHGIHRTHGKGKGYEMPFRWTGAFVDCLGESDLIIVAAMNLVYEEESFAIRGAAYEVYKDKGCGFVEPVYQECLGIEFRIREIPAIPQPRLLLDYKGHKLNSEYLPDFICYGKIIVELKAASRLTDEHRAQVHNYLKATGFKLGLLINFGYYPKVQLERIVN
jgi:GxxExxY protein